MTGAPRAGAAREEAPAPTGTEPQYRGLRVSAEEYLALPDDGYRYELVEGVVVMSPSPTLRQQAVVAEILAQIMMYLREHPVGHVFPESDVHLGTGLRGGDLVYRPDLVFVRAERLPRTPDETLRGPPDLVVEVVSPGSRRYDAETKRQDYERLGVREYWLVDPERGAMTFLRLVGGRFVEPPADGETFASEAVPGFALDLVRVRKSFNPW